MNKKIKTNDTWEIKFLRETKKTWNTPEMKEQARLRRLKQKFPKRETSIARTIVTGKQIGRAHV